MSTRARMTMRAIVQYNTASATDDFGQPVEATWATTSDSAAPCWAWHKMIREVEGPDKLINIQTVRMMARSENGITLDHRILRIEDRLGKILFLGPFKVDGDPERRRDHYEYTLRAVDSGD